MTTPDVPAPEPTGSDLDVFGGASAEQVKEHVAAQRAELARQSLAVKKEMDRAKAEMEAKRAKMEAEFRAAAAELEASMAPLRAELARMEEMGQIVDLYLGRGEHVETVREGSPADVSEPIVIRQRVLVMSEEAAILFDGKDGYGGIDADNVGAFIAWLQEPENLDRLLPEPKCVVVLIPTRVASRSGNLWEDMARDKANRESYWFVRNGERVSLMRTNKIVVGERLVPKRDEFVRYFADRDGRTLAPGSAEWIKAEEAADAQRRHYMKLMLTLQGLVDRTSVWHPLPADGVNLLSIASQDSGRVRIVNELDLILTDGRESFRDWQRRLNSQLRVGHRIIGDWNTGAFRSANEAWPERDRWHKHSRLYPQIAPHPSSNVLHTIEDTRDGMLVIRYERTDEVWKRNVPVPDQPGYVYRERAVKPTQRASCLIDPSDTWVLPFDLATVDDLTYYLNSREARTDFLSMVPVVRAALAAKRAEADAEAPFRDLLARQVEAAGCASVDVAATVDRLVHEWKVRTKYGRALNGDAEHEAKAAKQIIDTYRAETVLRADDERMIAVARGINPDVVCVGATKSGVWRSYAPTPGAPRGERVFLDVTEFRKDGTVKTMRTERIVASRHRPAHVAWSAPDWGTWTFDADPGLYLTPTARAALIEGTLDRARQEGWTPICVTEKFDPSRENARTLSVYAWTASTPPATHPVSADADTPVGSIEFTVTSDAHGATLGRCHVSGDDGFTRYHASSTLRVASTRDEGYRGRTELPWWPDDAKDYGDHRARLRWVDDDMFDAFHAWDTRRAEAANIARAATERRHGELRRYAAAINKTLHAEAIERLHAEFLNDYGENAEDVWEHHLSTLRIDAEPIHPWDVIRIIESAQRRGEQFEGCTLGALAAAYNTEARAAGKGHYPNVTIRAEHADTTIPTLTDPESDTSS